MLTELFHVFRTLETLFWNMTLLTDEVMLLIVPSFMEWQVSLYSFHDTKLCSHIYLVCLVDQVRADLELFVIQINRNLET